MQSTFAINDHLMPKDPELRMFCQQMVDLCILLSPLTYDYTWLELDYSILKSCTGLDLNNRSDLFYFAGHLKDVKIETYSRDRRRLLPFFMDFDIHPGANTVEICLRPEALDHCIYFNLHLYSAHREL